LRATAEGFTRRRSPVRLTEAIETWSVPMLRLDDAGLTDAADRLSG
jgi:hypothetical protein